LWERAPAREYPGMSLLPFNGNISVTIKNMSFQIKELLKADGDSPFVDWFGSLEV
jgi:hypothetical protein